MHLEGIPAFDAAVMEFVQTHLHGSVADAVFPILTYLGEAGAVWILPALILLFFRRTRTTGVLMLAAMLFTFVSGELILKNIVCRPRPCHAFPDIPLLIARPDSYSFPSGPSGSSFAAATILFQRPRQWGAAAPVPAAPLPVYSAFLFVH